MSKRKSAILAAMSEVSEGSVHAHEIAETKAVFDHSGPSADALRSLSRGHANNAATAVVGGVLRAPGAFVWRSDASSGDKAALSAAPAPNPAAESLPTLPSVGAALRTVHHGSSANRASALMGGGIFAVSGLVLGITLTSGTWVPVLMAAAGFAGGSKMANAIFGSGN